MTRSKLREHIFKALFLAEFYEKDEFPGQVDQYLENAGEMTEKERGTIWERAEQIAESIPEIDEQIDKKTTGWKTSRMGKVELTILRLAVYEILQDETIPSSVAINEAVELAKAFGGEQSPAFVNGVLARFA